MKMKLVFGALFLMVLAAGAHAQGIWVEKTPMSTPRNGPAMAALNGKVYALGGQVPSCCTMLSSVEAYDPATDTWTTKSPMPTARWALGAAAVNGTLYAIGGCTDNGCSGFVGTVEAYDPVSDSWTTKTSMPTPRRDSYFIGVINGAIYVVGGLQGPGSFPVNTNEAYDPMTNSWSTKSPIPTALTGAAAAVFNGLLYIIGGHNGSAEVNTVYVYNPSTDTWAAKAPVPVSRSCGAATINGTIYDLTGGDCSTLLAYDPIADSWGSSEPPMPTAAPYLPRATTVNGILYAIAGDPPTFQVNQAFIPFAFPSSGSFVIGDLDAAVGNTVTFWGAQWAKVNSMGGGSAPNAFKGFADQTSTAPPACGGMWTTHPGNSSGPPDAVPPFMAVIASSSVTKSGHTITGDVPKIVIVQTNPGYAPDPGHAGTGTVVAVLCGP